MIWLSRETRFALIPPAAVDSVLFKTSGQFKNSWAGWPASDLIAPQLRLQLIVAGTPDARTGYLCNIKIIDDLFRNIIINDLIPAATEPILAKELLELAWQRSLVPLARRGYRPDCLCGNADSRNPIAAPPPVALPELRSSCRPSLATQGSNHELNCRQFADATNNAHTSI